MTIFLACLLGIVVFALVVNRIGGATAHYVETFPLDVGERRVWEDMAADAYPVLRMRAAYPSYRRWRRGAVLVTNRRILVGTKPLFGTRHMIQHVLYPSDRPIPDEAKRAGGGLLQRGYVTWVFDRTSLKRTDDGAGSFVDLELARSASSSIDVAWFRIHSDAADSFVLPE